MFLGQIVHADIKVENILIYDEEINTKMVESEETILYEQVKNVEEQNELATADAEASVKASTESSTETPTEASAESSAEASSK